jgi:alpha-tubulin suppressor-like RCC1 family protein
MRIASNPEDTIMRARWSFALGAAALLAGTVGCREDDAAPTEPGSPAPEAAVAAAGALTFWQVSGGGLHSCGVTTDHRTYCWGYDFYGQIGDGTFSTAADHLAPAAVLGGLELTQVSLGSEHSCGITTDRRAYCWGHNFNGELGDGTTLHRPEPVAVLGGLRFRSIATGQVHTCGLTYPDSRAYCWGDNSYGELGDGTRTSRSRPVAVRGDRAFRSLDGGVGHTCGVTTANTTFCWGRNDHGQLGDGTLTQRLKPARVTGGQAFQQVGAGDTHTCAVTTGHQAFCWGFGRHGQLGNGDTDDRLTPTPVAGGLSFGRVSAGVRFTCGETLGDKAYCWGSNRYGQIGDGTTVFRHVPRAVTGGLSFKELDAGYYHVCAKTDAGVAYCWGRNTYGAVGDGTTTQRLGPTEVAAAR